MPYEHETLGCGPTTKCGLVAVGVVEHDLAHTVVQGLSRVFGDTAQRDGADSVVKVLNEQQVDGFACSLWGKQDVEVAVFGDLPYGFDAVGEECWFGAQERLVPIERAPIIRNGDAGKEVERYVPTLLSPQWVR